jgi:phosphotransacetylase
MPLPSFEQLCQRADALPEPLPISVAAGADRTVLEALRIACDRGWVKPLIVAKEAEVHQVAGGISLQGFTLIDSDEPAATSVETVRRGQARLLMKGQIATPALLKAMLEPSAGLRTGRVICQVVLMEIVPAGRRFLLADTGICIQPTLEQKLDILRSSVEVARRLGEECPRVAALAATETVSATMPETADAAELQRLVQEGAVANCVVRGPLSFDLAYQDEAAARKKITDPVCGRADILLFPNLLAANLTVKAIMYTADCKFGGVLCGAGCPVVFMSRADTTATRLHSLALALTLAASALDDR